MTAGLSAIHGARGAGFGVDLRLRQFFLDRQRVIDRIGKQRAKSLNRAGTFARRAARKLLGAPSKKARPRPAGRPPRIHTSDERITLRNILYAVSTRGDSVIIGPVKLNQVNLDAVQLQSVTVPELHEFGGEAIIREESLDQGKSWRRRDLRRNLDPKKRYRERRAKYPARPTMGPTLKLTLPKVPELFGGTSGGALFSPGNN